MKLMYHWTINFSFEKIFPLKQQFQCAANRDFANGAAGPFNVIVFFFVCFIFAHMHRFNHFRWIFAKEIQQRMKKINKTVYIWYTRWRWFLTQPHNTFQFSSKLSSSAIFLVHSSAKEFAANQHFFSLWYVSFSSFRINLREIREFEH